MASIDESYIYDDSDGISISMNALEDIRDGSQIQPDLNTRYSRLKISDRIKQTQNEWKVLELSLKSMGKGLHKVFKAVVKKLKNEFPNLGESGSEVLQFIPEPINFAEVTRLPIDVKKAWLKVTLKDIINLINNPDLYNG